MTPEEKHHYMLNTSMYRLIPAMAIPSIASLIVNSLYSLADTYFVSQLGTYATGAVGINFSIDNVIMMNGTFLAAGASSYMSRLLGAKKRELANRVLSTAFFTALMTGLLILIIGLSFAEPLVRLLGATENIVPYALQYAAYVFLAAPFMTGTFVLGSSLRAEGNSTYSMVGTMVGAVVNIVLDPIFIFTLDLGVAGASMATAISKVVSFIVLIIPYLRHTSIVKIHIKLISYTRDVVPEILRMGSPSLLRTACNTISSIVLNNLAAGFGESVLAATSVVHRVMMMPFSTCLGFGQGYMPVGGYAFGARRFDRVKSALRAAMIIAVCVMIVIAGLCFVFAPQLIHLFTETDAEMLAIGQFSLRIQCLTMPLHAATVIANFFCTSLGKPVGSALLGTSRQGICLFPILPFLVKFWGQWGLAGCQAAADVLSLLLAIPIIITNLRYVKRLEAEERGAGGTAAATPQ